MVRTNTATAARALLIGLLALIGFFAFADPAMAADGTSTASSVQTLALVNMVVSFIIPLVLQLVTNSQAPEPFKAVFALAVAAIVGALTPFLTGLQTWPPSDWAAIFLSAGSVFLTSILAHYGLWKPVGITGSTGSIATAVPGGVGGTGGSDSLITQTQPDVTNGEVANPVLTPEISPAPVDTDGPTVDPDTVLDPPTDVPTGEQESGADPSPDVAL